VQHAAAQPRHRRVLRAGPPSALRGSRRITSRTGCSCRRADC
jgi:hypothetical protein